ncbi:DUF916 domain-containing protein [Lactococcus allomyrinae]|uniref:DUF916 domain-containing protein n=1 Tax=Lactococcus allomyrinae TaxID=2419773 RepID=A0A387BDR7_9LACT|nr:DUF916 domain-containing protein [Lactococcus allomyrinae]AYG00404.1 DUF916 domain-containing protein [Lactococcus allomyrinae]
MKQKYVKYLIISLSVFLLIIGGKSKSAQAEESVGFSVTPVLEENQIESGLGYFNLLLKPNQNQTLKFDISNSSDSEIKVSTSFGTAFTGNAGNVLYTPTETEMDPSLKINIKDYVHLPAEVAVPAHSKVTVSAEVTMPKTTFKGVIAGGSTSVNKRVIQRLKIQRLRNLLLLSRIITPMSLV